MAVLGLGLMGTLGVVDRLDADDECRRRRCVYVYILFL